MLLPQDLVPLSPAIGEPHFPQKSFVVSIKFVSLPAAGTQGIGTLA